MKCEIYLFQRRNGPQIIRLVNDDPAAAAAAKSLRSCPTLCDPIDGSPLGSSVSGILQARILQWVAISFSSAWKWKAKVKSLSRVLLLVTPWTAAYQAPPSMGFSMQESWSGVPLPSPFHPRCFHPNPVTSQEPHLQELSHYESGPQHKNFEGHKLSIHRRSIYTRENLT